MLDYAEVGSYVGLDVHSQKTAIKAIAPDRSALLETTIATESTKLRKALRSLPKPIWVMAESGCMTGYIVTALQKAVDRVVICETRENRWISMSEDKGDPQDADRLARLLRMGEFKEVHVPGPKRYALRELMSAYHKNVADGVRIKNRIKAVYRKNAIPATGSVLFTMHGREQWLKKLKVPCTRFMQESQYEQWTRLRQISENCLASSTANCGAQKNMAFSKPYPALEQLRRRYSSLLLMILSDFPRNENFGNTPDCPCEVHGAAIRTLHTKEGRLAGIDCSNMGR